MFWSLVRPDRISPLRCEVRIVGDEKKAIVDALNAPMDEARRRMTLISKGASSTSVTGRLASGNCNRDGVGQTRGRGHAGANAASTIKLRLSLALSRRKQGVRVP